MTAKLVHDGREVLIPSEMGMARSDQMQGTEPERLIELAGRVCYDSLGTGRASFSHTCPECKGQVTAVRPPPMPPEEKADWGEMEPRPMSSGCGKCKGIGLIPGYHEHLLEVRHYSVHEHVHMTVETELDPWPWFGIPDVTVVRIPAKITEALDPKEGEIIRKEPTAGKETPDVWLYRVTFNLRHVLEWPNNVTAGWDLIDPQTSEKHLSQWGDILAEAVRERCPRLLIGQPGEEGFGVAGEPAEPLPQWRLVEPQLDSECFVSLFLQDSRVWSHEMVRHRGNMSQRSGRFVDESQTPMEEHPVIVSYLREAGTNPTAKQLAATLNTAIAYGRQAYADVVSHLQPWLERKRMSPTAARKQARSAARYYLGNGLQTEMIFTASIRHWRHIFNMRINPAADAAIAFLMEEARHRVKSSQYGHLL